MAANFENLDKFNMESYGNKNLPEVKEEWPSNSENLDNDSSLASPYISDESSPSLASSLRSEGLSDVSGDENTSSSSKSSTSDTEMDDEKSSTQSKKEVGSSVNLRTGATNKGEKFTCDIWKKKFTPRWSLISHLSSVHNGEKNFSCNLCVAKFTQKHNLDSHVKS